MTTRVLTNISASTVSLPDFLGTVLNAGESVNALSFGESAFLNSSDVVINLLNGNLKVSDGIQDYFKMDALNFIKGLTTQFTKDGKTIIVASDRPKDYYRCFTGNGDDLVSTPKVIGKGPHIHLIATAGNTATFDVRFLDDVYIRDGEIRYLNAGFDSHLNIEIFCPPNIPFPHPTKQGTLDLTANGFVANTTSTGVYMTAPVEVKLFRFVNDMHLVGSDNSNTISSPEPFMLNYPYFMRFTLEADPDILGELKAAVTIGMFRKKTI